MPRLLTCLCLLCAVGLPAVARGQSCPTPASAGVIFVADGSGALSATSNNLEELIAECNLGLRVERVEWSHGRVQPITDLVRHSRHLEYAAQLAESVRAERRCRPDGRIILIGHSAGAAIVLAAAECLPADSVERIILLAPAVSCGYDLRAALRCSREGIDSFYSKHDPVLTSIFVLMLGTADRRWEPSAGWLGFDVPEDGCGECIGCKLRQYGWSSDLAKTGYLGGHYGCREVGHLRERVLPLLLVTPCQPARPALPPYVSVWPEVAPRMALTAAAAEAQKEPIVQVGHVEQTGVIVNPRLGLMFVPAKRE